MTETLIFIAGVILGLVAYAPLKAKLTAKLADPQPVMGGPIQPDDDGKKGEPN